MTPKMEYGRMGGIHLEVAVKPGDAGSEISGRVMEEVERKLSQACSYRGKVLSLEHQDNYHGGATANQGSPLAGGAPGRGHSAGRDPDSTGVRSLPSQETGATIVDPNLTNVLWDGERFYPFDVIVEDVGNVS